MNDHQLLCFLTVSRTLNFSSAARELFCTQPALSYQIRGLEKELGVELFRRSTTSVELTEAGCALLPCAQDAYRAFLRAHTAVRPLAAQKQLTLRLPLSLLQRDPIYPVLMERLRAALPDHTLHVCTDRVAGSLHRLLTLEADAAVYMPFSPLPPEVESMALLRARCYLVLSPSHPLAGHDEISLDELNGHMVYYESMYDEFVPFLEQQPASGFRERVHWATVSSYEAVYASLLDGHCALLSPMKYDTYPQSWYVPLRLERPLPDVCLLTLCGDARAFLPILKATFLQAYRALYPDAAL